MSSAPRTLVLNVVGLTPTLLAGMPRLKRWADGQAQHALRPDLPAVTCTAQASMLTGRRPGTDATLGEGHGAVANGWYFRDLAEVWLWRQSVELITGAPDRGCPRGDASGAHAGAGQAGPAPIPTIFDRWRAAHPDSPSAQLFWWWNLPSRADLSLTPRPTYWADGRKGPDVHAFPGELRTRLTKDFGPFPLFQFWGPGAGIASSKWILDTALDVLHHDRSGLTLVYVPHLDYDLQRFGPHGPEAEAAALELDAALTPILDYAEAEGLRTIVLSEYGIDAVDRCCEPNRLLRERGWLQIHAAENGSLLDPGNSDAFAVCDHQLAHVYVKDPARIEEVAAALRELDGVDEVWTGEAIAKAGLAHARSGEIVLLAEAGSWFGYRYWNDEPEPDFARTVDIHRKPGYDPCELAFDPALSAPMARAAFKLLKKKLGFRTVMNLIGMDTSVVRGSHGRPPSSPEHGPVWIGPAELACVDDGMVQAHRALEAIV
jgi:predicted AlkP superfamily pyrophosphatase or phosphodiesterase